MNPAACIPLHFLECLKEKKMCVVISARKLGSRQRDIKSNNWTLVDAKFPYDKIFE